MSHLTMVCIGLVFVAGLLFWISHEIQEDQDEVARVVGYGGCLVLMVAFLAIFAWVSTAYGQQFSLWLKS